MSFYLVCCSRQFKKIYNICFPLARELIRVYPTLFFPVQIPANCSVKLSIEDYRWVHTVSKIITCMSFIIDLIRYNIVGYYAY